MAIEIKRVSNKNDIKKFLNFTWEEPFNEFDVPVLRSVANAMLNGKHPSAKYGDIQGWLILKDGEVAARTTIHNNQLFDEKLGEKTLIFGCTNTINDAEVLDAFIGLLQSQASSRSCTKIFGPASLLPNQQGGATVGNYNTPGFVDSGYTPEFFVKAFERNGFSKQFDSQTWLCNKIQHEDFEPSTLFHFDDERIEKENIEINYGDPRKFNDQRKLLLPLLNKSFLTLPYYTNIDEQEFKFQTEGLEFLIDKKLLIYLTIKDKPIAFVLVVPDISEFLVKCSGNLNIFNQLKLFLRRKKYRQNAVLIIKGTDPEFAGMGYQTLLHRELFQNLKTGGYRQLRSTFVEQSNPGSSASYKRAGGEPMHEYAFLTKKV